MMKNNNWVDVMNAVDNRINNNKEEIKMKEIKKYANINEAINIGVKNIDEYKMDHYGWVRKDGDKGMVDMDKFIMEATSPDELAPLKGNIKVIKLDKDLYITETDLMETVGERYYTLPLIYVIENVMSSYVENGDLDEVLMDYADEIIMSLIYKGEFIYAVLGGEVYWHGGGLVTTDMETVELDIPNTLELEKAADELLGFWRVVDNMDISDREKNEMKGHVFSDDEYSFVYQYCREIWWDGGSN